MESVAHLLKKDLTYCLELRCDKRVTSKLSENRCTVYYEVLVTQMKAYKEQKESEKSDRETALKSALVGMSFVTNDKGEKIISRMEMILYPKKKQTIINNVVTALMALLVVAIFFASYCFLIVPGWDATYEDCVADLIESGEYNDNVEVYDETNMYVYVEKDKPLTSFLSLTMKRKALSIQTTILLLSPMSKLRTANIVTVLY